ncbi:hypothetical protein MTR67_042308 [Solanum verrucosum]|uniref:Uncharacterized protein n=1 Tax=Solanum verrucosum TaxID=315347 RepID=A0AAF0ULP6_SOLVR|nr:hypothetical protein MTR67_042308 [Solanum verrucosum]
MRELRKEFWAAFKKRNKQKSERLNEVIIDSNVEWICPTPVESVPITKSGLPSFIAQPNSQPHLSTVEESASVVGNRAQQWALKMVSEYLKYSIDDDDDDDDEEMYEDEDDDDDEEMYEDEDDDDDVMEVEKEEKNLNFFSKLFEEDGGLREYYEKNSESGGEFSGLVCHGVGKKGWSKRFKDCVGLIHHSTTI